MICWSSSSLDSNSFRLVIAGRICDPLELACDVTLPLLRRANFVMAGRICDPLELVCEVILPLRLIANLRPLSIVLFRPPWRMWRRVNRSRSIPACEWIEYCDWWESKEWRRDWADSAIEMRRTALTLVSESSELRLSPKAPAAPTIAPRRVTNFGIAAAHAELTSFDAALFRSMLNPTGSSCVLWMLIDMRPRWFRSRRLANAWAIILCLRMRTRSSHGFLLKVLHKIQARLLVTLIISYWIHITLEYTQTRNLFHY